MKKALWAHGLMLVFIVLSSSVVRAQNITKFEYFVDTDPGVGLATAVNLTPGTLFTDYNIPVSTSALSPGFHTLYIRSQNELGNWTHTHYRTFFVDNTIVPPTISSFNPSSGLVGSTVVITGTNFSTIPANNTVRFNGTQATVSASTATSLTVTVPVGATSGLISVVVGGLTANSGSSFTVTAQNLTALEYFFNTDPGPGNGTTITITPATTIDLNNINIPTTSLAVGWHTLCVRAKDANNVWGFYECRRIYIREPVVIPPVPPIYDITQAEYFYNTDNGPGTGTSIPVTAGQTVDLTNISLANALPLGWHTLHVRTKNADNVWGFYESRRIYVREDVIIDPDPPTADITQLEFFYNTDNGPGTGTNISITAGQNIDVVNTNLANTLPLGWHTMHVRAKNADNVWGFYESRKIYVREPPTPCCTPASPIVELEYFVDADPGVGLSSTKKTISPSQADIDLVDEPLNVGTQSLGAHKIYIRAKNELGEWSMSEAADFTVTSPCAIITAPSATGVARCNPGSVTLTASGADTGETYRWYATDVSLTPLFTGNPYVTPGLSVSTTYHVTRFNPTTFCESARTPVTASIDGVPKPALNISGSLTVCEGTTQLLVAPSGFVSYAWSTGATTQQITASTTGAYSVVVNNGVCSSPPSDAFTFTVNPKPAKPTISATDGGSLCPTGTVTLTSSAGSSYLWSSGQTTQNIALTSAGNFTVRVTNAGCQSDPSDAASVTATPPAKPTITVTGATAICGSSTVTLDAPSGFSGYTWSNGATTQQITTGITGNYTVVVRNGTCASIASDAVSITAATPPAQPVITALNSTALCNGAFTVLQAPASFNAYLWSNGETTRQIVVTTAGSFTVQVGNSASCLSTASTATVVTLTGSTCPGSSGPVVNNVSRCGPGAIDITATGATGAQVYQWYNVPTGGTVLFTGATYSPTLSATTLFYVSIFDPGPSTETNRSVVTASVTSIPTPVIAGPSTVNICAGSTVLLSAPSGFANYVWSNGATTQQVQVSTAANYTVQTGDGTCLSTLSAPVTVNVSPVIAKPIITTVGNTTLCGSGSVELSVPLGFASYLWSNGATTSSLTVSSAGIYSVSVSNAACTSPVSDAVTVSVVTVPAKPTISTSGTTSLCNGSFTVLSAPTGFSNYLWSNGEDTRQIVVSVAGAFTVQTGNAANCLSAGSDAVNVTLTGLPCGGATVNIPPPTAVSASRCGEGAVDLTASGAGTDQFYRWYDVAVGGTSVFTGATFTTPSLSANATFYVSTFDQPTATESNRVPVTATIITVPKPALNVAGTIAICAGGSTLLSAPGGFTSYLWSNNATAQQLQVTQAGVYSVKTGMGSCLSESSDAVTITVTPALDKPSITLSGSATLCEGSTLTLTAPADLEYLWSNGAQTRSITVSAAGNYSVQVSNGVCPSLVSDVVAVTVAAVPGKPAITRVGATEVICGNNFVVLTGPANFAFYKWSNGETSRQVVISTPGSYTVQVGNASNCLSVPSEAQTVDRSDGPCVIFPNPANRAPVIQAAVLPVPLKSKAVFDLKPLLSDPDDNLDINSLRIIELPKSGAKAVLDALQNLEVDYTDIVFGGREALKLQVCDQNLVCSQQDIVIEVVGEVVVFNGLSPDGDGINDEMIIQYVDILPNALENRVVILNRWGDVVFEIENYNNTDRVFTGKTNDGNDLPAGVYLYKIEFVTGRKYTGYVTLKR